MRWVTIQLPAQPTPARTKFNPRPHHTHGSAGIPNPRGLTHHGRVSNTYQYFVYCETHKLEAMDLRLQYK